MKQVLSVIFFLVCQTVLAQGLPELKNDPAIVRGTFANGVEYFLVKNPVAKGYVDMALVQKQRFEREKVAASFSYLPHFGDRKPYEYLADRGIGFGLSGYTTYSPMGTTIRFNDVPVGAGNVADSLLLMGWDIVDDYPYEQAMIISGDIDPDKVIERMKLMSMTVSSRKKLEDFPSAFREIPSGSIMFFGANTPPSALATVSVQFYSGRMPKEDLQTYVPLVSRMLSGQMGAVVEKRLKKAFQEEQIPVSDISFRYLGSSEEVEMEVSSVSVQVLRGDLLQASEIIAHVLSELAGGGVTQDEFLSVKSSQICRYRKNILHGKSSNADYVNKCIAAYILDLKPVAGDGGEESLFSRNLPPEDESALLDSYIAATLSCGNPVALKVWSDEDFFNPDSLVTPFRKAWEEGSRMEKDWSSGAGDVHIVHRPSKKVKIREEMDEGISGGRMWTFSNGMRVVYKQVSSNGCFNYGVCINGGYPTVPGIKPGESAYLEDLFKLYDIGGASYDDFMAYLNFYGITMDVNVGFRDLEISGSAPNRELFTLLDALQTMSDDRRFNDAAYEKFVTDESIRIFKRGESLSGSWDALEAMVHPGYPYNSRKTVQVLTDKLPEKADKYFSRQFSSWANGVLVLVGDLDEALLKDILCKYLGAFETGAVTIGRPVVDKPLLKGLVTASRDSLTVGPGGETLAMQFTALLPYSIARTAAFHFASEVLKAKLARELSPLGMYFTISTDTDVLPSETMTIRLFCRPVLKSGLPLGVVPGTVEQASQIILESLNSLCESPVSAPLLNVIKGRYLQEVTDSASLPETIVDAVLFRYTAGKNSTDGYKEAIEGVSPEDVKDIFCSLRDGAIAQIISK